VPEEEERIGGPLSPGGASIGGEDSGEDVTLGSGTMASDVYSEEFETAPGSVSDLTGGLSQDVADYSADAFEVDSEPNTPAHGRHGGAETVEDEFSHSVADSVGSEIDEDFGGNAERASGALAPLCMHA